jgi:hypothetical protein
MTFQLKLFNSWVLPLHNQHACRFTSSDHIISYTANFRRLTSCFLNDALSIAQIYGGYNVRMFVKEWICSSQIRRGGLQFKPGTFKTLRNCETIAYKYLTQKRQQNHFQILEQEHKHPLIVGTELFRLVRWLGYKLNDRGSILGRSRDCFLRSVQAHSGSHPTFCTWEFAPMVKRPGFKAGHSNSEVKNAWSYNSTPPTVFMA